MNPPISVLLADDHGLVRDALAHLLQATDNMNVVGCVTDAAQAQHTAIRVQPDVVLMDIEIARPRSATAVSKASKTTRPAAPRPLGKPSKRIPDQFADQPIHRVGLGTELLGG